MVRTRKEKVPPPPPDPETRMQNLESMVATMKKSTDALIKRLANKDRRDQELAKKQAALAAGAADNRSALAPETTPSVPALGKGAADTRSGPPSGLSPPPAKKSRVSAAAGSKEQLPPKDQDLFVADDDNVGDNDDTFDEDFAGLHALDKGAVSKVLNKVIHSDVNDQGEVVSSYMIAGAVVDPKIRLKIYNREYIELGILVPRSESPQGLNMAYAPGYTSQITLQPAKVRLPPNFFEWVKWFSTFSAIYTQKYPTEAPQLFSYIHIVAGLNRNYASTWVWRSYDEKFRKVKPFSLSLPWHVLDHHILHEALTANNVQANQPNNQQGKKTNNQQNSGSKGQGEGKGRVCYAFNKVSGCSNPPRLCKYDHHCSRCGRGGHPQHKCRVTDDKSSQQPK